MHQSCRILESNAEAMENYIVVSSEQYWNKEAESKRHDIAALASRTRHSSRKSRSNDEKSCIYLVSTGSELAPALGE